MELYYFGEHLEKECKNGNIDCVKILLQNKDIDFLHKFLEVACMYKFLNSIIYIIDTYKNIDITIRQNIYVRIAIINKNYEIVDLLLKNRSVDPFDCRYQAIHILYDQNDNTMLDFILERRPNLNHTLFWKYKLDHESDYHNINKLNPHPNNHDLKMIVEMCDNNKLTENDAQRIWGNHLWRKYIAQHNLNLIETLLNYITIDAGALNNWAIRWACENDHLSIIKLLLQRPDVDPSCNKNSCLLTAFKHKNTEIFNLLLLDERVNKLKIPIVSCMYDFGCIFNILPLQITKDIISKTFK